MRSLHDKTELGRTDVRASGSIPSAYVDIYNATSASWTRLPEGLGQARAYLAAAALSSGLVIFAGGLTGEARRTSKSQQTRVHECSCVRVDAVCVWCEQG
jgi:hypothetical protein